MSEPLNNQLIRRCKHGEVVAHETITDRAKVGECYGSVVVEPDYEAGARKIEDDNFNHLPIMEQVKSVVDAALKGDSDG